MKSTLKATLQEWIDSVAPQPCIVHYFVGMSEEYAQILVLHDDYMEVLTQLSHHLGPSAPLAVPYCSIKWIDFYGTTFPPHI